MHEELIALAKPILKEEHFRWFQIGCNAISYLPWWEEMVERFQEEGKWHEKKIDHAFSQGIYLSRLIDVGHALEVESYQFDGVEKRYQITPAGLLLWEEKAWKIREIEDPRDWEKSLDPALDFAEIAKAKIRIVAEKSNPGVGMGFFSNGLATMEEVKKLSEWVVFPLYEYHLICADGILQGLPVRAEAKGRHSRFKKKEWKWSWLAANS